MKKAHAHLLVAVTLLILCFVFGLYIGRNTHSGPMTLSFPEEMKYPVPVKSPDTPSHVSGDIIDINTASEAELTALPGIGEVLAGEIVAYRSANGVFSHVEQLLDVPGIGEGKFEAIIELITVGGTE